jgi:hypothetical protein
LKNVELFNRIGQNGRSRCLRSTEFHLRFQADFKTFSTALDNATEYRPKTMHGAGAGAGGFKKVETRAMQKPIWLIATFTSFVVANAALAETYILTLAAPLSERAAPLLTSTNTALVESIEAHGVHCVVIEAPNEIYVERFFSSYGKWPVAMSTIEGGWNSERFAEMSRERRLLEIRQMHCRFCFG